MDDYLTERSHLFKEASEFSCPDACERYGCRDPELHVTISLVDLIALSQACGNKVSSLFRDHCKIGFDPVEEDKPWIGRLMIELNKPCSFLGGKKCKVYLGRPIACALFPEAFFILGKGDELLKKEVFQKFPCIAHPTPVPYRRKEVLHKLLRMAAQETFLSDYYLFGVSPFLVDLKSVAGRVLEGLEVRGEKRAVIPHHRFEEILKERLQGSHRLGRIKRLDRDEDVREFWSLKEWTDEMATLAERDSSAIVHPFVGNRLEGVHFLR